MLQRLSRLLAVLSGLIVILSLLTGISAAAEPAPPPTTPAGSVPAADADWDTPLTGSRLKVHDGCSAGAVKLFGGRKDGCTKPKAVGLTTRKARTATRAAATSLPAGCAASPEGAWHFISRVEVCARTPLQAAKVYNRDRTEQVGQLNYFVTQYWHAEVNADGRAMNTWSYEAEVVAIPLGSWGEVDGAGVAAKAFYCEKLGVKPSCPRVLDDGSDYKEFPRGDGLPTHPLVYDTPVRGTWTTDTVVSARSGEVSWATVLGRVEIVFPDHPDQPAMSVLATEPDIRCDGIDSTIKDAGCVFPQQPDVMTFALDNREVQEHALHIRDAQRRRGVPGMNDGGPAPGEPGGVPLTRGDKDDANRKLACPDSLPRPPGGLDSCDEYPFNSTGEGAGAKKGVSCRMIDKAQNSKGGTNLNLFYQNHHVLKIDNPADPTEKGDAFYVQITGKYNAVSPRAWAPNADHTCGYPDLYIPPPAPLTDLDLSAGNRRGLQIGLRDWSKAGYLDGGDLPGAGDFNPNGACAITSAAMQSQYGVRPNDGQDDTGGIQNAIDHIKTACSPSAGYHFLSQITLPAGTLNVTHQIYVDADYTVLRGEGSDPGTGTRIVYTPDANTRYDKLTADGADWDEDAMTVDRGDGNAEPAPGGWIWPGRGLFRVQARERHPDYENGWKAAPQNRKDIFEGTVNVHWKVGAKLKESAKWGEGLAARTGDMTITLADSTNSKIMANFKAGAYVNIRAANTMKFYQQMEAVPTEHELQNLHMRQQIFKITAVNGKTITLDKPLEYDVPVNSTSDGSDPIPGLDKPFDSKASPIVDPVLGVGIENLYFTQDMPSEEAASASHNYGNMDPAGEMHGIVLKWAINGWVKGVRSYMTGSHAIVTEEAKNLSVINNYLEGSWNKGKGGNGYFRGSRVWDSVYAGNATRNLRHFTFQWSASGNVAIGNDFDSDLNLHGGWERDNIFELNRVNTPYGHRPGSCYSNCGDEGGSPPDDSQWFPIWWAAGKKAVKWSGSSGYNNIFFNNIMKKQLDSSNNASITYYPDRTKMYSFGSTLIDGTLPTWKHLTGPDGAGPIANWAGYERDDFCTGNRGVWCEPMSGKSLFLNNVPSSWPDNTG
ncbi:NucA/NucB deoxyribonuclease domain-containing protein [Nonomuraea sp. CA-143628]|uniref:NucA/NucB deoxyribonuclease domain-containing protein n=1 Tax=Nonomuraea sp. CA-143628 TaxID=3239997 RepID=UPI003D8E1578